MQNQKKSWYQSKTVIAGIVTTVVAVLSLFGIHISAEDSNLIVQNIDKIVLAVTGIVAVIGRIQANQRIGKK